MRRQMDLNGSSLIASSAERLAGKRLTKEGVLVITAARFRSQERNREDAEVRLVALLQKAAVPPTPRRATRPSRAAKKRRLESKTQRGETKKLRRRPRAEE